MSYKYNRLELKNLILNCKKTKDSNYYVNNIIDFFFEKGNCKDNEYYYDRKKFINCVYFDKVTLKYFLSKKEIDNYEFNLIINLHNNFKELNLDLLHKKLNEKIDKYNTLEDLIDNYVFLNYFKFNIINK